MIYNLIPSEAGVSKAYVIVFLMICMSFTGCIEDEEDVEEKDLTLKDSFDDFVNSLNTENWRKYFPENYN